MTTFRPRRVARMLFYLLQDFAGKILVIFYWFILITCTSHINIHFSIVVTASSSSSLSYQVNATISIWRRINSCRLWGCTNSVADCMSVISASKSPQQSLTRRRLDLPQTFTPASNRSQYSRFGSLPVNLLTVYVCFYCLRTIFVLHDEGILISCHRKHDSNA